MPVLPPWPGHHIIPGPPLTGLTWWVNPADATKVFQVYTNGNDPCWSVSGVDGNVADVVESTYPGPIVQIPLGIDGGHSSGVSPIWEVSTSPMPLPTLKFDGVDDRSKSDVRTGGTYAPINTLLDDAAKTFMVAFQIHSASLNDTTLAFNNHPILYDSNKFLGTTVRNDSGTYKLQWFNRDGPFPAIQWFETPISLNTNYVVCYRHDGTDLFGSINGGTETSTPSGTTANGSGAVRVAGDGARFTDYSLGEILCWNLNLTGSDFTTAMTYMTGRWL